MIDISLKVEDLKSIIEELEKGNIEFVELSIDEPFDLGDGEIYPKHLSFIAYDGEGGGIDFEDIKHIDVDPFYKFKE